MAKILCLGCVRQRQNITQYRIILAISFDLLAYSNFMKYSINESNNNQNQKFTIQFLVSNSIAGSIFISMYYIEAKKVFVNELCFLQFFLIAD